MGLARHARGVALVARGARGTRRAGRSRVWWRRLHRNARIGKGSTEYPYACMKIFLAHGVD